MAVNFAAESHVDRSIENPEVFQLANVWARRYRWTPVGSTASPAIIWFPPMRSTVAYPLIGLIIHKGRVVEVYNIGIHNEMRNTDIVKIICKALDKPEDLSTYAADQERLWVDRSV